MSTADGYFSSTQTLQSTFSNFTAGSVIFQGTSGFLTQDNTNFFWDDANNRLGIGTNTPNSSLQIVGNIAGNVMASIQNINSTNTNSATLNVLNDLGNIGSLTIFGSTFAATYLQNVTRVSGTGGLWLTSDVSAASGGTDPISFSVGGYNNVTAQATTNGLKAINLTDTGIAVSNVGAPLSINNSQVIVPGVSTTEVSSTASATAPTGTDTLMAGMTITPVAGTYLVWFSCDLNSASAGAVVSLSIYVGGSQKADSLRKVMPFAGGTLTSGSQRVGCATNGVVTVNGSQAIEIRWSTSSNAPTAAARTMNILRVL